MAFTFNWAGLSVPSIQVNNNSQNVRTDAANWGGAVRGYNNWKADQEYADIAKEYRGKVDSANSDLASMKAEVQRLRARNDVIRAQLAQMG